MLNVVFDRNKLSEYIQAVNENGIKGVQTSSEYLMLAAACLYGAYRHNVTPDFESRNARVDEAHDELAEAIAAGMLDELRAAMDIFSGLDALNRLGIYDDAFRPVVECSISSDDHGEPQVEFTAGAKPGFMEIPIVRGMFGMDDDADDEDASWDEADDDIDHDDIDDDDVDDDEIDDDFEDPEEE